MSSDFNSYQLLAIFPPEAPAYLKVIRLWRFGDEGEEKRYLVFGKNSALDIYTSVLYSCSPSPLHPTTHATRGLAEGTGAMGCH